MEKLVATLLGLLSLPWLALSVFTKAIQARCLPRLRRGESVIWMDFCGDLKISLYIWSIAAGRLKFVGPRAGSRLAGQFPVGLYSPSYLQTIMGMACEDMELVDQKFFTESNLLEQVSLCLRSIMAGFITSTKVEGDRTLRIFGVQFVNTTMAAAVQRICAMAETKQPSSQLIYFVNADCLNLAYRDCDYRYLLHKADMVLPDGSGIRLAAKWLGAGLRDNLNGTDLFPYLCDMAANNNKSIFLLGGKPGVAQRAAGYSQQKHMGLVVAGTHHGYFEESEITKVIAQINDSGADILLVGFGAPFQERWLTEHADRISASVSIGVGGLFDFISKDVPRAPTWLREIGCEWVWRIVQQPMDKWKRYIIGNPLFLARVFKQRFLLGRESWLSLESEGHEDWFEPGANRRFAETRKKLKLAMWRSGLSTRNLIKRSFDLVVAGCALIALSPILLVCSILTKCSSPGPIVFRQTRIGLRGKPFTMLKFRSMTIDAETQLVEMRKSNESEGDVLFKIKRDPRVTPIGYWMRKYSLDELPQLFNVLIGDMSLVGPRPALPNEVDRYRADHLKRLQVRPGLTCWWQVSGRSDLSFLDQVRLDREYLENKSFREDIRLLIKTIPAVLFAKGAV